MIAVIQSKIDGFKKQEMMDYEKKKKLERSIRYKIIQVPRTRNFIRQLIILKENHSNFVKWRN